MVAVLSAIAAALALFSCGDDDERDDTTGRIGVFTGRLDNTDALIGITMGKANVVAWACNGASGMALRFSTRRTGDSFEVTAPEGFRLAGRLTGDTVNGSISGPNGTYPFRAELTEGNAGVWTSTETVEGEQRGRVWVVLRDGTQQGATFVASRVTVAPRLDTATGRADGSLAIRSNPASSGAAGQFGISGQHQFGG